MKWSWCNLVNQWPIIIAQTQSNGHMDDIFILAGVLDVSPSPLRIKKLPMLLQQPPKCSLVLSNNPSFLLSYIFSILITLIFHVSLEKKEVSHTTSGFILNIIDIIWICPVCQSASNDILALAAI